jgi:hypothetical protein
MTFSKKSSSEELRGLDGHIGVIYHMLPQSATDHISPCITASELPFGTIRVQ